MGRPMPPAVLKTHKHLLPLFVALVVVCYLDRTSLAFAALQLCHEPWFSPRVYGLGSGVFYAGYVVFQIPSNLMLSRLGARIWLPTITAAWGTVACCSIFISSPASFYALRLALGVAEAGAFPACWHVCGQFYPPTHITLAYSAIEASIAVSQIVAAPVAAGLLQLSGLWGLAGWQHLFLAEGVATLVMAGLLRWRLPASITTAPFLTPEDKLWLLQHLHPAGGAAAAAGSGGGGGHDSSSTSLPGGADAPLSKRASQAGSEIGLTSVLSASSSREGSGSLSRHSLLLAGPRQQHQGGGSVAGSSPSPKPPLQQLPEHQELQASLGEQQQRQRHTQQEPEQEQDWEQGGDVARASLLAANHSHLHPSIPQQQQQHGTRAVLHGRAALDTPDEDARVPLAGDSSTSSAAAAAAAAAAAEDGSTARLLSEVTSRSDSCSTLQAAKAPHLQQAPLSAGQQLLLTVKNKLILYLIVLKAFKDISLDGLVYWVPLLVHALIDGSAALQMQVPTSGNGNGDSGGGDASKHCGGRDSQLRAVLLSAIPFGTAALAALLLGHSSEATQERRRHVGLPLLLGGCVFAVLPALLPLASHVPAFVAVTAAVVAADATTGPFWTWVHMAAAPGTQAVSLAAVNSCGKAVGSLGPLSFGLLLSATGSYVPAILFVAGVLVAAGLLALLYPGDPKQPPRHYPRTTSAC